SFRAPGPGQRGAHAADELGVDALDLEPDQLVGLDVLEAGGADLAHVVGIDALGLHGDEVVGGQALQAHPDHRFDVLRSDALDAHRDQLVDGRLAGFAAFAILTFVVTMPRSQTRLDTAGHAARDTSADAAGEDTSGQDVRLRAGLVLELVLGL